MFENLKKIFKKFNKKEEKANTNSKDAAKERLHLVLMQDRANVSADFLELMKQEIIEVIKKYIDVDESAIDVRLTNKENSDGTNGAPALYANIPILNIKNEARKVDSKQNKEDGTDKKEVPNSEEKEISEETKIKKEQKSEKIDDEQEKSETIIEDKNENNEEEDEEYDNNQNEEVLSENAKEKIKSEN